VSRFGNAPAAGQALSAPDRGASGPVSARASGANAGWAIEPPAEPANEASGTWWSAGAFFLISTLAALLTVRRYSTLT
jgi:hypothetical protein